MSNIVIPFVGGMIERLHDGKRQLLLQTRYKPERDPLYSGTLEFAAGTLDKLYENVYDTLAREINEETGLTLARVINDNRTDIFSPKGSDAVFGFRPFCCTQQLKDGRPWIGFIFRCEVEDGEPADREGETKDVHWEDVETVRQLFNDSPERFFALEVPAWDYYFKEVQA